jgi:hypothetical protein
VLVERVSKRGSRGLCRFWTEGRKCFRETGRFEEISWGAFLDLDVGSVEGGLEWETDLGGFKRGFVGFWFVEVSWIKDLWALASVPKSMLASSLISTGVVISGDTVLNYIIWVL